MAGIKNILEDEAVKNFIGIWFNSNKDNPILKENKKQYKKYKKLIKSFK